MRPSNQSFVICRSEFFIARLTVEEKKPYAFRHLAYPQDWVPKIAEIQIDGLASRDEEFLSGEDLEKDLEEVSEGKKREKTVIVYLLSKQKNENPSPITDGYLESICFGPIVTGEPPRLELPHWVNGITSRHREF